MAIQVFNLTGNQLTGTKEGSPQALPQFERVDFEWELSRASGSSLTLVKLIAVRRTEGATNQWLPMPSKPCSTGVFLVEHSHSFSGAAILRDVYAVVDGQSADELTFRAIFTGTPDPGDYFRMWRSAA